MSEFFISCHSSWGSSKSQSKHSGPTRQICMTLHPHLHLYPHNTSGRQCYNYGLYFSEEETNNLSSRRSSKTAELVFELKAVWVLSCHAMLPSYTRDLNRWQVTHKTNSKCRHPCGDVSQGMYLALRPHLSFPLAIIETSIRHPFSS